MMQSKRVLFCPLDWGLGHATRCIPVIREFQSRGAEIFIASSDAALELLKIEFPNATFFELPSYRPRYSDKGSLLVAMITQLSRFYKVIHAEHSILERLVSEIKIDLVISDNRFGCWSSKVKSVFITHQVNLLMPQGFGWASGITNSLLHRYIRKFTEIWIPDAPEAELTAPFANKRMGTQKYVGWLSRFHAGNSVIKRYDIIALVSGPEPQRSIFEKILTSQLRSLGMTSLLVTGEPQKPYSRTEGCLEIVNHLNATELEKALLSSETVISRSGYSSVMDLIALGKSAIFVPTPQQPEQLFLADYLKRENIVYAVRQDKFELKSDLEQVKKYKGLSHFKTDSGLLTRAIDSVLL